MSDTKLIYLMGAGRSGTTALATFLAGNPDIHALGEMHQFFEHIQGGKFCSCSKPLKECNVWSKVMNILPKNIIKDAQDLYQIGCSVEAHHMIIQHIVKGRHFSESDRYLSTMTDVLSACQKASDKTVMLDSAKFISRALALRHIKEVDLKVIYMVRDLRGVVHSFSKNVQSRRTPLSTILYYMIINMAAEFVRLTALRGKVIKVRYEDMMDEPEGFFTCLEKFLGVNLESVKSKIANSEQFEVGHIIGGNRLREQKTIIFRRDMGWEKSQTRMKQILIYLGGLPLMLLNRYKIFPQD